MPTPRVIHGDCIDEMRKMDEASIDAIVTDPPYGLGFMGKKWDELPPGEDWARECLRVLKPGGHLLAFGGTRTWHRLAVAVEDAGFEIRDSIAWMYGSGFPKSHNIGDGRGTALKPAFEPVVVARKPLVGTVAANVLKFGTGALNIDACRIESGADCHDLRVTQGGDHFSVGSAAKTRGTVFTPHAGRWPANVVLDDHTAPILDQQSGNRPGMSTQRHLSPAKPGMFGVGDGADTKSVHEGYNDSGGASRFFYCAKAPKCERPNADGVQHPTVKPLALMRWLVRLVTPPGGTVLDPFAGSGTTIEAALLEGFDVIGIEREAQYLPLIQQRIDRVGDTLC